MRYNPERHHRKSIRLQGYDYSKAGAYFVTMCSQDRECLFGEIVEGKMHLNDAGRLVLDEWEALAIRFPGIELDAFVVMPNHVHGVIVIGSGKDEEGDAIQGDAIQGDHKGRPYGEFSTQNIPTLGDVIGALKSRVTLEYIRGVKEGRFPGFRGKLWQRNYYEHIIRNEDSLNRIKLYIASNPANWESDNDNPTCATSRLEETW